MDGSAYREIVAELAPKGVTLLAVSKTKPAEDILSLYDLGQRDFGENYVQELIEKQPRLPQDIRWHFIGHLQTNKVKYIAGFVHLIQGVDSEKLLSEIDKQAVKADRIISCLLEVHIASEETKFGLDEAAATEIVRSLQPKRDEGQWKNIRLAGLMGMASNTEDPGRVAGEFGQLQSLFQTLKALVPGEPFNTLSMGMSSDYRLAIEHGSTMVRIGTRLFGQRQTAR